MKMWAAIILSLVLVTTVQAQTDPSLSETYEGARLTFQYPADWNIDANLDAENAFIIHIPIPGEGAIGEGMVMSRDDLPALISVQTDSKSSALKFAQDSAAELVGDGSVFQVGIAVELQINDRDAAYVDVLGLLPSRFAVMSLNDDAKLLVMLNGVPQQFSEAMPILFEVLSTMRLDGDDKPIAEPAEIIYALPDIHTRKDSWSFLHPADWPTEEGNSFTLMRVPGIETTIGISAYHDNQAADLQSWAEETVNNIMAQVNTGEHTISDVSIDNHEALRLDFVIAEENFGYTEVFLYREPDIIIRLTIIGTITDIAILTPIVEQIIASVEVLN